MHIVPHNNIVKTYNNTHVHLRTNQQSNTTPVKKTTMSIVPSECKVGDNIWTVNHYQVTSIRDGWYSLRAEDGSEIRAQSGVLEKAFHSVSKYTREEKVSQTSIANKIRHAGHADFEVTFHKKLDEGVLGEKLHNAIQNNEFGENPRKRKRWLKENLLGEKRVMQARLHRVDNIADQETMGRIPVYDLEKKGRRLIDVRTITSLVLEGVKYTVK